MRLKFARMKMPLFAWLALPLALIAATARAADPNPEIKSLGADTYALTRWADNTFQRNVEKLKEQALQDAAAYCASLHRELKVVSVTTAKPWPTLGFAHAKVLFKALEANDPALHAPAQESTPAAAAAVVESAPPKTETEALYGDLLKLDELRKRGLLTEEEFQARRKRLAEGSK